MYLIYLISIPTDARCNNKESMCLRCVRYHRRFPLVYRGLVVKLATFHLVSGFMTDAAVSPLYYNPSWRGALISTGRSC